MRVLFTSLLCIAILEGNGQDAAGTEYRDSTNIYYQSLSIYLKNLEADQSGQPIYIEKDNITTVSLPQTLGPYKIKYVDGNEINSLLKKKRDLVVVHIVPLRVKDGDFFVNIIPFQVQMKKKNVTYINSAGTSIHYRFDGDTHMFKFSELKRGNI